MECLKEVKNNIFVTLIVLLVAIGFILSYFLSGKGGVLKYIVLAVGVGLAGLVLVIHLNDQLKLIDFGETESFYQYTTESPIEDFQEEFYGGCGKKEEHEHFYGGCHKKDEEPFYGGCHKKDEEPFYGGCHKKDEEPFYGGHEGSKDFKDELLMENFEDQETGAKEMDVAQKNQPQNTGVQRSETLGSNEDYEDVSGELKSRNQLPNDCYPKDVISPQELLPKDVESVWAQSVPSGQGSLSDKNFLNAGFHVGVNTVGQSLRNANRQLRSEPANPQVKVSPWLQSTIEPDTNRRPLEIS